VVPTIAYNTDKMGIGFSPIIQYGALDVNYLGSKTTAGVNSGNPYPYNYGSGMASDLGYGFSLGGYYDVNKQVTLGASYTSAINMKYKNQLNSDSGAASGFGVTGISDNLEQPAEIKVGAAYTMGNIMLTGDLKQVKWGDAKGYKDFGWQDQNVLALGVKYSGNGYWLGVGYNKADNPIKAQDASIANMANGSYQGGAKNMFNNIFFPATTEQHFSVGGGYDLTKSVTIDGALMYAPEVTTTLDTSSVSTAFSMQQGGGAVSSTNTTTHSQMAYTMSVRYKF
jgi:long-chain fatty acid transport protein